MKYLLPDTETERLKFRVVTQGDFEDWMPLFEAPNVAKFLGLDESLSQRELCQKWFDKVFHRYENEQGGMNALISKETGKMVGQCGILVQAIEGEERLEIGYSILPEYWGKGFASEAAQKCKEEAFKREFSDRLMSTMHVDNIASELVAKKNGMSWEKTVDIDAHGAMNVFSISKSEWSKK